MPFTRRNMLTSVGALASATFLPEPVAAARNPAAQVGDRTTTIRIKSLKATPFGPKVYVKIETNHGVTGWGEIDQLEPKVAAALAESLLVLLDGENPTRMSCPQSWRAVATRCDY